jgi:hypothetical protein
MSINLLYAFEFTRKYDATVGLYGDIGHGVIKERHDNHKYTIHFTAKPTSLITDISGIVFVEYQSQGVISPKGVFIPEIFTSIITEDDKKEKIVYIYNHVKKYIVKKVHIEKQVDKSVIDSVFGDVSQKRHIQIINKSKKIKYVSNDYLTLIKNARFLEKGAIEYLDQNSTNSLKLLSKQGDRYKIKIKSKDDKYLLEMQNDIYGLVKAKTLNSLALGDADLKAIKMKIIFK